MVPFLKPLLAGLLAPLAIQSAAANPAPPKEQTHLYALPHFENPVLSNSWVIADFDGDGRPDFLSPAANGATGAAGSAHGFDLQLGAGGRPALAFSIRDSGARLNLIAWDVDGDHDLDLVVVNAASNRLLEVWINDGAGRFTKSQRVSVPDSLLSFAGGRLASPVPQCYDPISPTEEERAAGTAPAANAGIRWPGAKSALSLRSSSASLAGLAGTRPARAPPASSLAS